MEHSLLYVFDIGTGSLGMKTSTSMTCIPLRDSVDFERVYWY